MKILSTLLICSAITSSAMAQTAITNGGFENWGGNASPGVAAEPTNWFSNKSGSTIAQAGGQTCFQETSIVHSGTSCVRVETISGPLSTAINGNVTTGVVSAPSFIKTDGYIGTVNFSSATDIRRMAFTGRPDSITGWYQYTQGAATEQGRVKVILHTGDYFDPETPTTNHPDPTANKIGGATFVTPLSNASTWTRFSVPVTYVSASSPAYIMVNITSSADQNTSVTGSKLWIDDLTAVYNPVGVSNVAMQADDINIYSAYKTLFVNAAKEINGEATITIYDMAGRTVFTHSLTEKFSNYDLSALTTGVYVYKVNSTSFSKTGKIAIQ